MADNTIGVSDLLGPAPDTVTLLDGSTAPLPPATPDQPDRMTAMRTNAMGEIARLKGDESFRRLLLQGDPHALAKVQQLDRIIKTPTGTFYGGQQTPAEVAQHQDAWRSNSDVGAILGADVEQQLAAGQPISESEHRAAQARLAELKSDKEWVKKYFDGNVRCRAEFQTLHRMLQLPIAESK
jgi:hypothetical protein